MALNLRRPLERREMVNQLHGFVARHLDAKQVEIVANASEDAYKVRWVLQDGTKGECSIPASHVTEHQLSRLAIFIILDAAKVLPANAEIGIGDAIADGERVQLVVSFRNPMQRAMVFEEPLVGFPSNELRGKLLALA